jgi:hypothetical protein
MPAVLFGDALNALARRFGDILVGESSPVKRRPRHGYSQESL